MPPQEWRPIVVEIPKISGNVDATRFYVVQPGIYKKLCQRRRQTNRKAATFVQVTCSRIKSCCCIPEISHKLHFSSIVPDISRNYAARSNDADHFSNGQSRLGNEI